MCLVVVEAIEEVAAAAASSVDTTNPFDSSPLIKHTLVAAYPAADLFSPPSFQWSATPEEGLRTERTRGRLLVLLLFLRSTGR